MHEEWSLAREARAPGRNEAEPIPDDAQAITADGVAADPVLPLLESRQPDLAERVDDALHGFGGR